ncbi:Tryptophan--tRNA ligase [Porphyridium purpureum]|uniref:tryptophan--tRNA ligase n=1 Tax=Porphyridium purpureum TaxID=35688 RepID=A0A5J4Z6F0_PORPP|nr:Tryptophan--tRNA ligase [Porphyridium purpureum]|eukprot:POR9870..scf295_1
MDEALSETGEPSSMSSSESGTKRKLRVLSGVQPTGSLHLGNYFGAIRNWVLTQHQYESFFCVVDMHAITMPYKAKELSEVTYKTAALYLAAGIDANTSKVFVQSHVKEHAELTWLLNCITPMNWLERMIQYKEKARKQGENVGVGLFDYPVLMAADVLLYQTDVVPVGEDQKQHIELARDIARRFNDQFAKRARPRVLREPNPLIQKDGARLMSLEDGTSKMSKSAESDFSRINLDDDPKLIEKKIKRCKTDSLKGLTYDDPNRPEVRNLLTIYQLCTGKSKEEVIAECADMNFGTFKPLLTDAIIEHLSPIQKTYNELILDRAYLDEVLTKGAAEAREVAAATVSEVKKYMGFTQPL